MGKEAGLPKQRRSFPSLEAGFLGKGAGLSGEAKLPRHLELFPDVPRPGLGWGVLRDM